MKHIIAASLIALSSSAALENQARVLVATPDGPIEAIVGGSDPFSDLVVISCVVPALVASPNSRSTR